MELDKSEDVQDVFLNVTKGNSELWALELNVFLHITIYTVVLVTRTTTDFKITQ